VRCIGPTKRRFNTHVESSSRLPPSSSADVRCRWRGTHPATRLLRGQAAKDEGAPRAPPPRSTGGVCCRRDETHPGVEAGARPALCARASDARFDLAFCSEEEEAAQREAAEAAAAAAAKLAEEHAAWRMQAEAEAEVARQEEAVKEAAAEEAEAKSRAATKAVLSHGYTCHARCCDTSLTHSPSSRTHDSRSAPRWRPRQRRPRHGPSATPCQRRRCGVDRRLPTRRWWRRRTCEDRMTSWYRLFAHHALLRRRVMKRRRHVGKRRRRVKKR
jgi:hypothetical protein